MSTQGPSRIDPLAAQVLALLAGDNAAGEIVLGGYFALQQYVPYRATHDIDAWWKSRANPRTIESIRRAMANVGQQQGLEFRERAFGETQSFELCRAGKRVFSFQIAVRSVAIDEPTPSHWPPVLMETLTDNIASKMNALVDRGSPRDFTDIQQVVSQGLIAPERCWELWGLKNPGQPVSAARQKVLLHLSALEARRPLESISDPAERNRARLVRQWFKQEFAGR